MLNIHAYTDGSYSDEDRRAHGGIIYLDDDSNILGMYHVISTNPKLVSMRNIGGEIMAAKFAIEGCITNLSKVEEGIHLELCYDYSGIGNWITGEWEAKKSATIEYVQDIKKLLDESKDKFYLTLCQVAGHSGVGGNVVADKIACWDMEFCKNNNIKIITL